MQERLESSVAGRVLISLFLLVVVAGVVVWNLPPSELARQGQYRLKPVVYAAGLDQTWAVFAPDPPHQEYELEARIVYDDGTERTWRVPGGGPVVGAYWDYHWLKWEEWMSAGSIPRLWKPAAAWIARQEQEAGRRPVTVSLLRRTRDLPLGGGLGPPKSTEFYTYPVGGARSGPAR